MKSLLNINRVVFYGCSFTAGSELADQELLPNFSKEEINKLKEKEFYRFYDRVNDKLREELEKEKSWARWFADDLGLPYENRAKGGSSMAQIVFTVEQDLAKNTIKDADLIVVGTTSPERICRFTQYGPQSIILANSKLHDQWDERFERDFLTNIATDNYILYHWYKELRHLDLLSDRLQGRLFQQWVWATWTQNLKFTNDSGLFYKLDSFMSEILHPSVTFNSMIDNDLSFTTLDAWNPVNQEVLHHPKLEVQQQFGRQLANSFRNKVKWNEK
jgi:hypothetical protein